MTYVLVTNRFIQDRALKPEIYNAGGRVIKRLEPCKILVEADEKAAAEIQKLQCCASFTLEGAEAEA